MHMTSLKILRFLLIDTSIVVTELVVDIRNKIVICKIVICNVLINLLMYSIKIFKYNLACWGSLENHAID